MIKGNNSYNTNNHNNIKLSEKYVHSVHCDPLERTQNHMHCAIRVVIPVILPLSSYDAEPAYAATIKFK